MGCKQSPPAGAILLTSPNKLPAFRGLVSR